MKKLMSIILLTALHICAAEKIFNVSVAHDPQSETQDIMQVYFFDNFDDSIRFTQSLQKPKAERHKSVLGLHYLAESDLKKGKKQTLSLPTNQGMVYFVAVHAPGQTYTVSSGEVTPNDLLRIKVNKDGSLGYVRKFNGKQESVGWKK